MKNLDDEVLARAIHTIKVTVARKKKVLTSVERKKYYLLRTFFINV